MQTFGIKTKILIGENQIKKLNAKRIFIVTDKFMESKIEYITNQLDNNEYEIFSDVYPDPDISIIMQGTEKIKEFKPDTVIAFGGGSPIDAAKAIVFFAKKAQYIENVNFVAIPTTSGTGSEVTRFSVISDKEKGAKYPLIDESLLPNIAILDASLILSVPAMVTADTGIDVITHSIEAFVSNISNDFTDAMAEKSLKLAFENLYEVYKNPNNLKARQAMHNSSCLAGISFDNASLGINHSMAHIIGARFHLPHGRCNAILLPYIIEFNAGITEDRTGLLNPIAEKYAIIAQIAGVSTGNIRQSVNNLIKYIKKLNAKMGIPSSLLEAGVEKDNFKNNVLEMSEIALADRCTPTNPINVDKEIIRKLFEKVYFGK